MEKRILSKDLESHVNTQVNMYGWVNNVRALGKITFLILRDKTGLTQIVIQEPELSKRIEQLQPGSVLKVTGTAVKNQKVEIINPSIEVLVEIKDAPPIEYYKPDLPQDLDVILDYRSIALRNKRIQAIFKIQAEMTHAFRLYMHDTVEAVEYFGPNIIGASSEGGAEFFNVDYFGYSATLAQSSQLYKQMMVGVNERAFALMPFFRAEPSHTTRHLSEGKQFEFEMATYFDWTEVLDVQEGLMKFIVRHLETACKEEIELLGQFVRCPQDVPFPRLTFAEAQELYFKRTGIDERHEPDLSPASEREICAYVREKFGTDFVFITHWQRQKRPFYACPSKEDPKLTNTHDLLCNGTEITSGGARRYTYDSMVEGIKEKGMDPANFGDYLAIFKYGMPPHAGFGIGLERLTMCMLGLKNIREASLFPSDTKRIAGQRIKAHIFFGAENVRNEIIRLLKHHEIPFDHAIHEPTPTSEDSARVRQTKPEEGVKAIILRGKKTKKNFQFNLPAHLKIDMKAVSDLVGEKCEFEAPEVIKERYGITIGGVPPFGNLFNLETFFDEKILSEPRSAFNCGLQTESIIMPSKDLIKLTEGKVSVFSQ